MTLELEEKCKRICRVGIVVDDQYAPWFRLELLPTTGHGCRARDSRQSHLECRPSPKPVAARGDFALVHFDQALDHRQSDTQAALGTIERAIALHEQIENVRKQIRRNACTRIGNFDEGAVLVSTGTNPDLPARFRVLASIRKNVAYALDQAREVALHVQRFVEGRDGDPVLLLADL